ASAPGEAQLPYPMQLGSGTLDLMPGFTFLGMRGDGSWGLQGTWTVRLGENDRDYALGDALEGTLWLAYRLTDRISASARIFGRSWGDIEGADPTFMNRRMVPTIVPETRGGNRVDIPLGLNYYIPSGALAGHRLAVEMALPVVQDPSGPQLETDWILTVGWQKAF
ncbi:MAG: transporter, partial [Gemmatimonadetes bacterium]|nr:transporter [Gemmatimonadota bacterium]